jgi:hypothetical protein
MFTIANVPFDSTICKIVLLEKLRTSCVTKGLFESIVCRLAEVAEKGTLPALKGFSTYRGGKGSGKKGT